MKNQAHGPFLCVPIPCSIAAQKVQWWAELDDDKDIADTDTSVQKYWEVGGKSVTNQNSCVWYNFQNLSLLYIGCKTCRNVGSFLGDKFVLHSATLARNVTPSQDQLIALRNYNFSQNSSIGDLVTVGHFWFWHYRVTLETFETTDQHLRCSLMEQS